MTNKFYSIDAIGVNKSCRTILLPTIYPEVE